MKGEVALCLRARRRPLTVQEKQWRPAAGLVPDFYVETLATTIRAISGLSRQTPSLRMTKSAGSKTCDPTKSSTTRSTFGRSGSIRSNMNFDDSSLPSCIDADCRIITETPFRARIKVYAKAVAELALSFGLRSR
jgi:hypothetical protein